jgi:hypothetical protein
VIVVDNDVLVDALAGKEPARSRMDEGLRTCRLLRPPDHDTASISTG